MQEKDRGDNINETIISLKEPRLSDEDKLYVKAYLFKLSHSKAYKLLRPDLKNHPSSNPFSKKDSVQYHIRKELIIKTEALELDGDKIMSLLLQEATRLGNGSSPTARVQALALLGKQLGLFEEKKDEKENVTFNVINYSTPIESEKKEEVVTLENKEIQDLPKNLSLDIKTFNQ